MTEPRRIRDILDRVQLRFRILTVAAVAAGLLAAILVALAVEVAVDQILPLPRWLRTLAFLGGLSGSIAIGIRLLAGPIRGRVDDLFLARSIELQYPQLKSGLVTYVQLGSDSEDSAALREIVGERVAEDVKDVRPDLVVPSRTARRTAFGLGGAVAALLLLAAISPSGFWLSFRRSLMPIRNLTETQIASVLPGNAVAYKGKDVEIAIEVTGKRPDTVQLWITRDVGEPVKIELPRRPDDAYRCILPGVTEPFSYGVIANDATSDDYRVRIAEVPRLRSLAATLHFPKYTGFPSRNQDSGNIDAIEGTGVTLEGTASRPLKSAALVLKNRRIPAEIRGDRFVAPFVVEESLDYSIEMIDRDGTPDPEPSKGRIVARRDAAPQVTVSIPGKNVEVAEPCPVRLTCRVTDDFGITALQLTAKVNGKNPKVVPLAVPKERIFLVEPVLDLKALEVAPGDYVEYFLTATDNKEPSPQTGQSATFVVTVQSSLPLLTFADAHPDVKVEKYRDPHDRKGSVEPKAEKPLAEDKTKDAGKNQDPAKRELAKKEVFKVEEKKPEAKKDDPPGGDSPRAEKEAPREDALSKLLEEKKDLIEKLLAKTGKDGAGDSKQEGREGADSKNGEGKDPLADGGKDVDHGIDGKKDSERTPSDAMARKGDPKKVGKAGAAGKNGEATPGGAAEGGDGDGASESTDEGAAGRPGTDPAGQKGGATAKAAGKPGKAGKPGRAGRPGNGNGEGGDGEGDDGDGDGSDDDEDDYDLADLFPFNGDS